MKTIWTWLACLLPMLAAQAHDWHRDEDPLVATAHRHGPTARAVALDDEVVVLAAVTGRESVGTGVGSGSGTNGLPAAAFAPFAPRVKTRADGRWFYVESDGLPAHPMMVGITAWQQQVPLPQPYVGANAWRIPLRPVVARSPLSIRGRFLRGAVALAANGIPIFNPQNNRGEVSAEIGELDQWGGHCGRADDYHYHAAPLHLQEVLGPRLPIAFALDGYPIYGLAEPDGSAPSGLDAFNGHETAGLGYHYHASTRYPYVNGGFHGEVVEAGGQVDPQPRAQPVRPDLPPLRGAKITGFTHTPDQKSFALQYTMNGRPGSVNYSTRGGGVWNFRFVSADGGTRDETYRAGDRRGGASSNDARPPGRAEVAHPVSGSAEVTTSAPSGSFVLRSPAVTASGVLPVEFTGDGSGSTLPLEWTGAPEGTRSYALIMDHLAPDQVMKCYWTLWDIPAAVTRLTKNARGVGKTGRSFKGAAGYEPPRSRGPGAKTYTLHLYALSAAPDLPQPAGEVTREILLSAIQGKVLATADLPVVYTRGGEEEPARPAAGLRAGDEDGRPTPGREAGLAAESPVHNTAQSASSARPAGRGNPRPPAESGRGGLDNARLIKPTMADTLKVNVYADNWFMLYINGEFVAVDSIKFTPHNVVSVDILPEYPMTIAVMAKDNADPKTGLEYGRSIGDGGLCLKIGDDIVTSAAWKAKRFFHGPLNGDTVNPQVRHEPIPEGWWKVDFDDRQWPMAKEFTEVEVAPKQTFHEQDFKGAKFIWSDDIALDNTVIFRVRIGKPGWTKRWTTTPDLDVTGAPLK